MSFMACLKRGFSRGCIPPKPIAFFMALPKPNPRGYTQRFWVERAMDDLRLDARYFLSMSDGEAKLEEQVSVFIKDGRISGVEPSSSVREAKQRKDLGQHVLLPGYINAHGHAAMSLLRGFADDLPLMTWLNDHIWPAEGRWVGPEFVYDGTQLAIAEMLKSGTTTYADMYFFTGHNVQSALDAGMRSVHFSSILDFPTAFASNAERYIQEALAVHQQFKDQPLATLGLGPHAPYTVSDGPLRQTTELAKELNLPVQIHLHETASEVSDSLKQHGMRPIERLAKLGFLQANVSCVHMTQINTQDIERLTQAKTHIVHCPKSNLKLASGFSPIYQLQQAGLNIALGTDGAASNNDLNLQSEMRLGAMLAKAVAENAQAISAKEALYMATMGGAKALGIDQQTGSLEVGKWADMQAVNLNQLAQQPLHNPISQLVYTHSSEHTTHVWVAGKLLVDNGALTSLDEEKIRYNAGQWAQRISQNA